MLLDQIKILLNDACPLSCDEIHDALQKNNKEKYRRHLIKTYLQVLVKLKQVEIIIINTTHYYRKQNHHD